MATGSPFRRVLGNRHFLALWLGQLCSQMADRVLFVILVDAIVKSVPGSNSAISGLLLAMTLPAVVLGAVAGVFVDRWNKKRVLVFTNLARGLAVLAVPLAGDSLLGLYAVMLAVSVVSQFFYPAEAAAIPSLIPKADLLAANSLFTTTMLFAIIVGFALGDPMIILFGGEKAFLAVATMYVAAAMAIQTVRLGQAPEPELGPPTSFFEELGAGWAFIREHAVIRTSLLRQLILFSVLAAVTVLVIGYSRDVLQIKESRFGYLLAAAGFGMLGGAWAVGHFGANWSRERTIVTGFVGMGAMMLGLAAVDEGLGLNLVSQALILCTLLGLMSAAAAVPVQAILQEETPEAVRGKVFGVQNVLIATASTLPMTLAGIAADLYPIRSLAAGIGVFLVLGAFIGRGKKGESSHASSA